MSSKRTQRLQTLAQRRAELVLQARMQRVQLALQWHRLQTPSKGLEAAWQLWRTLRAQPWLWLLPAAALTVLRRRKWHRTLVLLPWLWRSMQLIRGRAQR